MIEVKHVFYHLIGAHSLILPLGVLLTLDGVHPWGLGWGCWWQRSDGGGHCLTRSRALHALLEWAAIVNGEVALA